MLYTPCIRPAAGNRGRTRSLWLASSVLWIGVCLGLGSPTLAFAVDCASGGLSGTGVPSVALRAYRASLRSPTRLAVDAQGLVYIADPEAGAVTIRWPDGRIHSVRDGLGYPVSVGVDVLGTRIIVGDGISGTVAVYDPDWQPLFELGQGAGELRFPADIAVDSESDEIWVTDSLAHEVSVYDSNGGPLFRFGGEGTEDGKFQFPMGIFIDSAAGEVLVVDQVNARIQIFDRAGGFDSCIGKKGSGSGRLNLPQGIWLDNQGRIFVTDAFEGWVHILDRQGATLDTLSGPGQGSGQLKTPTDLVIDPSGRLFVSSTGNGRLEMFGVDVYSDPEQFVPAELEVEPNPLDPLDVRAVVSATLEVPGYRLEILDPDSLMANGVPAISGSATIGDRDGDHEPDITVDFEWSAFVATLSSRGPASVQVTGWVGDLQLDAFDSVLVLDGPDDDGDCGNGKSQGKAKGNGKGKAKGKGRCKHDKDGDSDTDSDDD